MAIELVPEPDTENVLYIDEYPHLKRKVQLRLIHAMHLGETGVHEVIPFPTPDEAS